MSRSLKNEFVSFADVAAALADKKVTIPGYTLMKEVDGVKVRGNGRVISIVVDAREFPEAGWHISNYETTIVVVEIGVFNRERALINYTAITTSIVGNNGIRNIGRGAAY